MHSLLPSRLAAGRSSRSPLAQTRVTLGLLIDWAIGAYQENLIASVTAAARKRDVNLVCFAGGALAAPGVRYPRNSVFDLAGPENVDAIIAIAAGMGNVTGLRGVQRYCERFAGIPLVSVTAEIDGLPNLLVDNEAGMYELVTHLIRVHGHRRIVYVNQQKNAESEKRYQAYRKALADAGLEFHENLVLEGLNGAAAMTTLFDERRIRPETIGAIVTYTDWFAIEILDDLDRRGIRVPDQIAVCGFDDTEESHYTNPPLTTVRQPLSELGAQAVQLAMDLINGIPVAERTILPTQLVVRASCRCFARTAPTPTAPRPPDQRRSAEAALIGRRDIIQAELVRSARGALGSANPGWETKLFNALVGDLTGSDEFLRSVDQIIRRVLAGGGDVRALHRVMAALRENTISALNPASGQREHAEYLFHEARSMVGETLERAEAHERIQNRSRADRIAAVMTGSTEWPAGEFFERLCGDLPFLGVGACYVAVFDRPDDPSSARLMLAYDASSGLRICSPSEPFEPKRLMPEAAAPGSRAVSLAVVPLFFRDVTLGYMLIDLDSCQPSTLYVLPGVVSTSLQIASATPQHSSVSSVPPTVRPA